MPALDLSVARWRKSSRSSDVANCAEVAATGAAVAARDSKHLTSGCWSSADGRGNRSPQPCAAVSSAACLVTAGVTSSRGSTHATPSLYARQKPRHESLEGFKRIVNTNTPTIVILVGEGGMEKTRLLIEVEAALRDQYPEYHGIPERKVT
ncbi:MAG: DUF397 domain-containing protein [Pseudonocardiaceae bacterium]